MSLHGGQPYLSSAYERPLTCELESTTLADRPGQGVRHGGMFCWRLLLMAGRPQVGFFRLLPVANLTGAPPHRTTASAQFAYTLSNRQVCE